MYPAAFFVLSAQNLAAYLALRQRDLRSLQYERPAEMQEELLWVSEAAHVPVIWATQVLETFVSKGALPHANLPLQPLQTTYFVKE